MNIFKHQKQFHSNKEYLVIGAGMFGASIAKKLNELGKEVLVIDQDEERLKDIKDFLTEKTYVGVEKKAFSNSDEIIDELGAVKPRKVLEELMKEVSCYYGK